MLERNKKKKQNNGKGIDKNNENGTKKEENTGKSGITQIEQNRFWAKIEIIYIY